MEIPQPAVHVRHAVLHHAEQVAHVLHGNTQVRGQNAAVNFLVYRLVLQGLPAAARDHAGLRVQFRVAPVAPLEFLGQLKREGGKAHQPHQAPRVLELFHGRNGAVYVEVKVVLRLAPAEGVEDLAFLRKAGEQLVGPGGAQVLGHVGIVGKTDVIMGPLQVGKPQAFEHLPGHAAHAQQRTFVQLHAAVLARGAAGFQFKHYLRRGQRCKVALLERGHEKERDPGDVPLRPDRLRREAFGLIERFQHRGARALELQRGAHGRAEGPGGSGRILESRGLEQGVQRGAAFQRPVNGRKAVFYGKVCHVGSYFGSVLNTSSM